MREIKNATIESTMLGVEDHGVMILFVHCSCRSLPQESGAGMSGLAYQHFSEDKR